MPLFDQDHLLSASRPYSRQADSPSHLSPPPHLSSQQRASRPWTVPAEYDPLFDRTAPTEPADGSAPAGLGAVLPPTSHYEGDGAIPPAPPPVNFDSADPLGVTATLEGRRRRDRGSDASPEAGIPGASAGLQGSSVAIGAASAPRWSSAPLYPAVSTAYPAPPPLPVTTPPPTPTSSDESTIRPATAQLPVVPAGGAPLHPERMDGQVEATYGLPPGTGYPAPPPAAANHSAAPRAGLSPQRTGSPGPLLTSALLPARPDTASGGWRKLVFRLSRGTINPGPSADEARHRRILEQIRAPLYDCHRIAIISLKGGVGKTTTTVGLGSTLASLRGDRVVAIDANPDRGTLGAKVPRTSSNTVRDLLDNAESLHRYVDVRKYLSQAESRLEVLASANNPEISQAFDDADYVAVDEILQRHYSILLTDCGTGILHSAMPAVLDLADTLVIVSSSSADGGSSASATLDWLEAHGHADHVRQAVTVISTFPGNRESVGLDALERHFAARTRRVVRLPYDPHLGIGGRIHLDEMRKPTRKAFLEIAGAVAERFPHPVPSARCGDPYQPQADHLSTSNHLRRSTVETPPTPSA